LDQRDTRGVVTLAGLVDAHVDAAGGGLEHGRLSTVNSPDHQTLRGNTLVEGDVDLDEEIRTDGVRHGNPGGRGGTAGTAQKALIGGGHAGRGGQGDDQAGCGATFQAGDHHALGDLFGEEISELLRRPRGWWVGLRGEEVPTEHLLRSHAGRGDDVHVGGGGEILQHGQGEGNAASVEHAGGIDDGTSTCVVEGDELIPEDRED